MNLKTVLWIVLTVFLTTVACDDAQELVVEDCGNGRLDPDEECDGGAVLGPHCSELGYYGPDAVVDCRLDCRWDVSVCGEQRCGDGILQQQHAEQCDGDDLGGNSCVSLGYESGELGCTSGCGFDLAGCGGGETCGDGQLQDPEECDGSNLGGHSCESLGQYGGALGCTSDCVFDMAACEGRCGDGVLDAEQGEECDQESFGIANCQALGFYTGQLACTDECTIDDSACTGGCGDGTIDLAFGEQCERGDLGGATCMTIGYYAGTLACGNYCRFDRSGCQYRCGDGILQADEGEACDGSELGSATCQDFGFYIGALACGNTCGHVTTGCSLFCGDGIRQVTYGEACDGSDLGTLNCHDLGYWRGSRACDASCSLTGCVSLSSYSAGGSTCTVDDAGSAWCWGGNQYGQLGDGSTVQRSYATLVQRPPGRQFRSITVGRRHACAIDDLGAAWCWGSNDKDQMGNPLLVGTQYASPVAVSMPAGRTFTSIYAGYEHACAIDDLGASWCWGGNEYGQTGVGSFVAVVPEPTRVLMPTGRIFSKLSTLHHTTCALDDLGGGWCWGNNYSGQCGDGSTNSLASPTAVAVPPGTLLTDLTAGGWHSCAVDEQGVAWCWGAAYDGQLGDNTIIEHHLPAAVLMPAGVSFSTITASTSTTCALRITGAAWCWGGDTYGTLGNGSGPSSRIPAAVTMPSGVVFDTIEAGVNHVCALRRPGKLWCWGYNNEHQVGDADGSTSNRTTPSAVYPPL